MDAEVHDLHARFYLQGNCFEPDLSMFWPLDPALAGQVPSSMHDALARHQMGQQVAMEFPEAWRRNLVEIKSERRLWIDHWGMDDLQLPSKGRADKALEEMAQQFALMDVEETQWLAELEALTGNDLCQVAMDACVKYEVTLDEVLRMARTLPVEQPFGFR